MFRSRFEWLFSTTLVTGVLRSLRVGGRGGSGVERYQLHTESEDGHLQPVTRPWRQFEFVPRHQAGRSLRTTSRTQNAALHG
jgi:hypothetical protein